MKKIVKIVAIFCTLLVMTGSFNVFAAAADTAPDARITNEQLQTVLEEIFRKMADASPDADIDITEENPDPYDMNQDEIVTAAEMTAVLSQYFMADPASLQDAGIKIAEEAKYVVCVTDDGVSTVYIVVNIEENPQLFNLAVFQDTCDRMFEKQAETAPGGSDLLSYEHLMGELAMHSLVFACTSALGGANPDSPYHEDYNSAKDAELNIDEDRVSPELISFFGRIVSFFLRLFSLLKGIA